MRSNPMRRAGIGLISATARLTLCSFPSAISRRRRNSSVRSRLPNFRSEFIRALPISFLPEPVIRGFVFPSCATLDALKRDVVPSLCPAHGRLWAVW